MCSNSRAIRRDKRRFEIKVKARPGKREIGVFPLCSGIPSSFRHCFCSRHEKCFATAHDFPNPLFFGPHLSCGLLKSFYSRGE
jgi:hypothetical protein